MIELKSGVQIPESAVVHHITAALDGFYASDNLGLVQYDDTMPVVAVQLTVNNQPYAPGESAQLNYRMGKPWPDTHAIYNPCLGVDEEGVIYFSITAQCTTTPGKTTLTVEVTDGGVKNSAPIQVVIAENPAPKDTIESTDEFLTMQEILAKVQALEKTTTAAATSAAADKVAAQAAREGAEQAESRVQAIVAGNESYTKQETHDRFAGALVTKTGPAASLEVYPDKQSNLRVYANGFTQQAGTGDPSPTNVRALTNGGLKLVKLVLTGTENWSKSTYSNGNDQFSFRLSILADSVNGYCSDYKYTGNRSIGTIIGGENLYVYPGNNIYTVDTWKAMLSARYAAGDPVTVWYAPDDESQATGLYAPIVIEGGEYRATCLPLTAPLCEGDSVVSWAKSGCDKVLVLDGQNNGLTVQSINSLDIVNFSLFRPEVLNIINGIGYSEYLPNVGSTPIANATSPGLLISGNTIYARLAGADLVSYGYAEKGNTAQALTAGKAYFAAHPLTVWYRSTNYTPAADIPVSLETHQQAVLVPASGMGQTGSSTLYFKLSNLKPSTYPKCSHVPSKSPYSEPSGVYCGADGKTLTFKIDGFTSMTEYNDYFSEQVSAGTPVTIVYQLATPITYAHPAVVLPALPDDTGKVTITGQSGGTVTVVFNKSIIKEIAEIKAAMLAMGAQLSL